MERDEAIVILNEVTNGDIDCHLKYISNSALIVLGIAAKSLKNKSEGIGKKIEEAKESVRKVMQQEVEFQKSIIQEMKTERKIQQKTAEFRSQEIKALKSTISQMSVKIHSLGEEKRKRRESNAEKNIDILKIALENILLKATVVQEDLEETQKQSWEQFSYRVADDISMIAAKALSDVAEKPTKIISKNVGEKETEEQKIGEVEKEKLILPELETTLLHADLQEKEQKE